MMFTTKMTQLFAVILRRDRERVTEALLREGVLQFVSTSEIETQATDQLSDKSSEAALADVSELRKRIEGLLHTIGVIPSAPTEADLKNRQAVEIEGAKSRLDKIDVQRDGIRERQRAIQQEILKLEDIKRQVELYGVGLSGMKRPARQSMLSLRAGKLPLSRVRHLEAGLEGLPALHLVLGKDDEKAHHLLLSMRRDREQIDKLLSGLEWTDVELSGELLTAGKDVLGELQGKLGGLTREQRKLQDQVASLIKEQAEHFRDVWVGLRIQELSLKIEANFESSTRAVAFAGWLPSSKKQALIDGITAASEGRCYLEWHEAGGDEMIGEGVPVRLDNPKVLAPFQMLVSNFGVPEYGTIDPTPFVMPVYLAMFGLMFADAGQGFVLALLGAAGVRGYRGNEAKQGLYQLSWLIIWCGLSAIVFGTLLGSYFGMALFAPLWFDFHGIVSGHSSGSSVISDVYDVLAITIYFGISVIVMGLLFNWINVIRTRKWMELVFDKGGILGGWIYGGGVYIASYMISHNYKAFPPRGALFVLVGLPSLLLLVKEPYHFYKHRSVASEKEPNLFLAIPAFLMQWVVELLEIFSGYLSNTLSFMRVAGLGIAHVCLMISFFTLAEMTSGIFSILILVLGNILVIGLEGLSAGIQALRLNYYEFFTKFFHGTGQLHTPISLSSEV